MAGSEPVLPLSLAGVPASIGTLGRWLTDPEDVIATDGDALLQQAAALHLGFPRNWPAVFKQSAALHNLINNKLNGRRCRAIAMPPSGTDATAGAAAASSQSLHSFSNAERLTAALPEWQLVKGFAVFERLDAPVGSSFVAIRHWWNESPAGTWLDFTPALVPSCTAGRLLLVTCESGDKPEAPLRGVGQAFAIALGERLAGRDAKLGKAGDEALKPPAGSVIEERAKVEVEQAAEQAAAIKVAPHPPPPCAPELLPAPSSAAAAGIELISAPRPDSAAAAPTDKEGGRVSYGAVGDAVVEGQEVAGGAALTPHTLGNAEAIKARASALFRGGRLEDAEKLYMLAAEALTGAAIAAKERGNDAFKRGDVEAANEAYELGLEHLGLQVRKMHYYPDQADAEFGRILRRQLPPTLIVALHSNRAATLLQLGRYKDAVEAATKALTEKPSDAKARLRRARAYRQMGGHVNLALSASEYAHALQLPSADAETVRALIEVWLERAPEMAPFVHEVRVAADKAGGRGAGGRTAIVAAERALCEALHNIGSPGDWARLGDCALGTAAAARAEGYGEDEGATGATGTVGAVGERRAAHARPNASASPLDGFGRPIHAARLLARRSMGLLVRAALQLTKRAFPDSDVEGARSLLRACAWIVGLQGSMETEDAVICTLHEEVLSDWSKEQRTSIIEVLSGPEPACIAAMQLVEALCRRRVANLQRLKHVMELGIRIFSFRTSARVRAVMVSLFAWAARDPSTRQYLFERYDEATLRPIRTAIKDYARHCKIDTWEVGLDHEDYAKETGLVLSDGGSLHIFNPGVHGSKAHR